MESFPGCLEQLTNKEQKKQINPNKRYLGEFALFQRKPQASKNLIGIILSVYFCLLINRKASMICGTTLLTIVSFLLMAIII